MTSPAQAPDPDSTSEEALGAVIEELTRKIQAGQPIDFQALIRDHPDQAEQLQQLLPALHMLAGLSHSEARGMAPSTTSVVDEGMGTLGDFRILREVGRGGMGVVYEAEQISLGRKVALKVLPFAATLDAKHLQRFKTEAQAAGHLHHQNIVPVYAVGCERGVHYYAMQFIEGQTLAAMITELRRFSGREKGVNGPAADSATRTGRELWAGKWAPPKPQAEQLIPTTAYPPPDRPAAPRQADSTAPAAAISTENSTHTTAFFRTVARLGIQAAEALEHAHGLGVVHRDIKPGNVLVDHLGNLWITDFGLAQMQGDTKLTMSGDLLGTIRYMSPEQALAKRIVVDHRTDIYSLGATLYELLTLEPVFHGQDRQEVLRQIAFEEPRPPRRLNRAMPLELATIVTKALAKNPAERYATAQELADDFARYLRDEPIKAKRPTLILRIRKWARRRQELVWTAGTLRL
jgi:serine/threonine-protein kinase